MAMRKAFLNRCGLGAVMLAMLANPVSAMMHMPEGAPPADQVMTLDPTDPTGFETPLLRPGRHSGLLGIYHPTGPFTISAQPGAASVLPGAQTDLLVYGVESARGSLVNPVLWVEKGQQVTATLENNLTDPTIIHWHGLILDAKNDGGPLSAGIGAVAPEASYDYSYKVLNRGGTYWYHPHPYLRTAEQAYRGLASFYIVDDEDERRLRQRLDLRLGETDIPVVIQDKRFDMDNQLIYEPTEDEMMMGFLGDTILANLTPKPYLDVQTRIYRFRLLNGSTARIYKLAFVKGDESQPFFIIGTDGGLLVSPIKASEVFLAPGERVDVLVDLSKAKMHDEIFLKSLAFDPMDNEDMGEMDAMGTEDPMAMPAVPPNGAELYIMKLRVAAAHPYHRHIPHMLSTLSPIDLTGATTRPITLATQMDMMGMRWVINGVNYNDDPERILFDVTRDSVEIWEIANDMASMPHPMHIHGYQFQVLERMWMGETMSPWEGLASEDGLLPTDRGWKDTVLIWPGEKVRIAIDFSHPFPGEQDYVFHCHNLEHEEGGMMINYRVK